MATTIAWPQHLDQGAPSCSGPVQPAAQLPMGQPTLFSRWTQAPGNCAAVPARVQTDDLSNVTCSQVELGWQAVFPSTMYVSVTGLASRAVGAIGRREYNADSTENERLLRLDTRWAKPSRAVDQG